MRSVFTVFLIQPLVPPVQEHLVELLLMLDAARGASAGRITVVVSPDLGNAKQAAAFARMLKVPVAAGAKQRFSDDRVVISTVIGDVVDRDVIVLDDEIAKGSTVFELLDRLREQKVRSVRVACTHGLFASAALRRLSAEPDIAEIVCTNTVPIPAQDHTDKLTVLSVAPALAEAMRRIHNGESVSALFG